MIAALQNVVFYPVQGDTAVNADEVKFFEVWAYPTFVILDGNGEILQRTVGFGDADTWSGWLEGAKEDPITLAARKERFASKPSFQDALVLGQVALSKRSAEAEGLFEQAARLDPQAAEEAGVPMMLVAAAYRSMDSTPESAEHLRELIEALLRSPNARPADVLDACQNLPRVAAFSDSTIAACYELAYPHLITLKDEKLQERRQEFLVEYALYVEHDPAKAAEMRRASMPAGWESDPSYLNEFAWWCFEHKIDLAEAESLARRGVELTPPGSMQANVLDTVAQIVYLRGDAAEAATLIRQALEMDPENKYLQAQLEKFTAS